MTIKITNKTGGLLVCDLAGGETLRANAGQTVEIREDQITGHLNNLVEKGLVLKEVVPEHLITENKEVSGKSKEKKEVK